MTSMNRGGARTWGLAVFGTPVLVGKAVFVSKGHVIGREFGPAAGTTFRGTRQLVDATLDPFRGLPTRPEN
jgi:hypothetical protein